MGEIPQITFVKDLSFLYDQQITSLYSKLDTGPKTEKEALEDKLWNDLEALELETNGLGLKRGDILLQLQFTREKSMARHRYDGSTAEQFNRIYRKTLERDDGEKK